MFSFTIFKAKNVGDIVEMTHEMYCGGKKAFSHAWLTTMDKLLKIVRDPWDVNDVYIKKLTEWKIDFFK